MKKTAGLLVLILLSTTACFEVTVPASKPAEAPAAAAAPVPQAEMQARDASIDDGAEAASRAEHADRGEGGHRERGGGDRSPAFERCMGSGPAAEGVQPAMLQCAVAEESRQDDRLNQIYQEVMAGLDDDRREHLRDRQREWIHERDQKCARDESGGSNAILEEHICKMDMTIDRRARLERRG